MAYSRNIKSVLCYGSTGVLLDIECQFSNGLPVIIIVGLGNRAVDEAKERIRNAFASSLIQLPRKRITINLAPADIPKESTSLDIPISMAILQASGQLPAQWNEYAAMGEIGLDGRTRPIRGIIGTLLAGKELGLKRFIVPFNNLEQALLVPGIEIVALKELKDIFPSDNNLKVHKTGNVINRNVRYKPPATTLSAIVGQPQAKRALEIVAAGGHNILLSGPPGTGKSMLAKALPSLLPPLSHQEMLEVTHLHSLSTPNYDHLISARPFRSPHHSSSNISILGGGNPLKPGEITLSHYGVLFLDEIPEFNHATLEALRQPLEDRKITISRAKQTAHYPARFILVATANPCPCGYLTASKDCRCTNTQIMRYRRRLSGPIIDRIDLHVIVGPVRHELLLKKADKHNIHEIVERIAKARATQALRHRSTEKLNVDMNNTDVKRCAQLSAAAENVLNVAASRLQISARSYMRLIKVSRTIADLEGKTTIEPTHVSEALQYRPPSANL